MSNVSGTKREGICFIKMPRTYDKSGKLPMMIMDANDLKNLQQLITQDLSVPMKTDITVTFDDGDLTIDDINDIGSHAPLKIIKEIGIFAFQSGEDNLPIRERQFISIDLIGTLGKVAVRGTKEAWVLGDCDKIVKFANQCRSSPFYGFMRRSYFALGAIPGIILSLVISPLFASLSAHHVISSILYSVAILCTVASYIICVLYAIKWGNGEFLPYNRFVEDSKKRGFARDDWTFIILLLTLFGTIVIAAGTIAIWLITRNPPSK